MPARFFEIIGKRDLLKCLKIFGHGNIILRVKKHGGALQNFFDILKDVAKGLRYSKFPKLLAKYTGYSQKE